MLLSEALGSPPPDGLVPGSRTSFWKERAALLSRALSPFACTFRIRNWRSLWSVLHSSPSPPFCTWSQLIGDHTFEFLVGRPPVNPVHRPLSFMSWNTQWLIRSDTASNESKRAIIERAILKGTIVGICETHWSDIDKAKWASAFTTGTVVSSSPLTGPNQGAAAGVAIIVPSKFRVLDNVTVIPGCMLSVKLRNISSSKEFCVTVIYLPPSARRETLDRVLRWQHPSLPGF